MGLNTPRHRQSAAEQQKRPSKLGLKQGVLELGQFAGGRHRAVRFRRLMAFKWVSGGKA